MNQVSVGWIAFALFVVGLVFALHFFFQDEAGKYLKKREVRLIYVLVLAVFMTVVLYFLEDFGIYDFIASHMDTPNPNSNSLSFSDMLILICITSVCSPLFFSGFNR